MSDVTRDTAAPGTGFANRFSRSSVEALLHVSVALVVIMASVSSFAVTTVFGIVATFVLSLLVTVVLPTSVPVILICSFLYQNVFVAWFTPFIPDNTAFDALRGANFVTVMTAYGCFFAASFQTRLRAFPDLRPWLIFAIALAGVIVFYLGVGAAHGTPKDAIVYFRNTIVPLACFHIAVVAATLYRVELRKSVLWLGAGAIVYGYCELIFKLGFLGLFHGDLYIQRSLHREIESGVWQRTLEETGFVIRGLQDILTTNFFNTPLLAGIFPSVFRIGGPNFHPISYAYALAVLSSWLVFRGRWLLVLSALPLLMVVGSKGAMFMLVLALMARVLWSLLGARGAVAATLIVAVAWVVAAIGYGATHGDYHVLGMTAGIDGFLHNPFGQGLGIGGNLSSTTAHVDWEHAQRVGYTAQPMESAVGVMLYQMGAGSLVFFAFLAALAVAAYRTLVRTGDPDFLFAFVAIVAISANAVLQEEAFYAPLALGFCMLIVGTAFGTRFRRLKRQEQDVPFDRRRKVSRYSRSS